MSGPVTPIARSAVLIGVIGVGFVIGRSFPTPSAGATVTSPHPPPQRSAPRSTAAQAPLPIPSDFRSTDTLDDLLAAAPETLYERLALWLVDARPADMAAYWEAIKPLDGYPNHARDLLFLRWTLHDPHAAISAAKGTRWSRVPWWAWARNEPMKALHFAMEHDGSHLPGILQAIAETDPKLAQKLLEDHPELPQDAAFSAMLSSLTREDPQAAVELLTRQSTYYDPRAIEAWLREDPHTAFDWLLAHREDLSYPWIGQSIDETVLTALRREQPELLGELAAKCPPGRFRQQLEEAMFDHALEQDPAAALAQARNTPSPLIAARQLIKIALRETPGQPEQSIELLDEILHRYPTFPEQQSRVFFENGYQSSTGPIEGSEALMQKLLERQPEMLMQRLLDESEKSAVGNAIHRATHLWAQQNPAALVQWADAQVPEMKIRGYQAAVAVLADEHAFPEAMQFATQSGIAQLPQKTLRDWLEIDPNGAAHWARENEMSIESP